MSRLFVCAVAAVTFATLTPANASAMTYDKLAYLTFTAPVQVPGVTLSAGTYQFHLTNPDTSRNVLQVLSNDGAIVYAMFHTRTDERLAVTEEATVTFMEVPVGVAPPVKTLFYGGEHRGYEFVYPKGGPNMLPDFYPQPPVTYTRIPAPVVAAPPASAEPVVTAAIEMNEVAPPVALALAEPMPEPVPVELPRTATPLPLIALGGLGSAVAGVVVRVFRRRAG